MIEIIRIEKSIKNPRFLEKNFSDLENEEIKNKKYNNSKSIAARFCAKEAFAKAVGLGFRGFNLKDVEILHNDLGQPYINLIGNAKKLFEKNLNDISVSLTHTKFYACAVIVCNKL